MKFRIFYDLNRGWKIYNKEGLEITDKLRLLTLNRLYRRLWDVKEDLYKEDVFLIVIKTKETHTIDIQDSKDDAICYVVMYVLEDPILRDIFDYTTFSSPGAVRGDRVEWEWSGGGCYVSISSKI